MLIQEKYRGHPWKMLVCCILLNRATRAQVDKVEEELFQKYPTPTDMAIADLQELYEIIKSLGFGHLRADSLKKFCKGWLEGVPIEKLIGMGGYVSGFWKTFQEIAPNVDPTYKELKKFLKDGEDNGI